MQDSSPTKSPLQKMLEERGFTVLFRCEGWSECLLSEPGKSWLGRGADDEDALMAALSLACPSEALRVPLAQEVTLTSKVRVTLPPADPAPKSEPFASSEPPPEPRPSPKPAPDRTCAGCPKVLPLTNRNRIWCGDPCRQRRQREKRKEARDLKMAKKDEAAQAERDRSDAILRLSNLAAKKAETQKKASEDGKDRLIKAKRDLVTLLADFEEKRTQQILSSSPLQRWWLCHWMVQVRLIQSRVPKGTVHYEASQVAFELENFSRKYWPGNIPLLRVDSRPSEVLTTWTRACLPKSAPPRTWEQADLWLKKVWRTLMSGGVDAHGWSDQKALKSAPTQPEVRLLRLAQELEAVSGPLKHAKTQNGSLPSRDRFNFWIAEWRWMRGSVQDVDLWGLIGGRLRFWVHAVKHGDRTSKDLLSAVYVPKKLWAEVCGVVPVDPIYELRQSALALPPSASMTSNELHTWLATHLDLVVGDTALLEKLLRPLGARATEALDPSRWADLPRGSRRRLTRLMKTLSASKKSMPAQTPPLGDLEERGSSGYTPSLKTVQAVRAWSRQKSVLYITGRKNLNIEQKLNELFGFQKLRWCNADRVRVLQGLGKSLRSKKYDVIFVATGFMGHKAWDIIRAMTKGTGIPVLTVHEGRPRTCFQEVAKHLGLDP